MILEINSLSISTLAAVSKGMLVGRDIHTCNQTWRAKSRLHASKPWRRANGLVWMKSNKDLEPTKRVLGFSFKEMWHLRMLDEI